MTSAQINSRAKKVKLLLMDVDGVLTDGRIYYVPSPHGGMFETKTFHSRDGLGLRFAIEAGLRTGIISGRSSPVVEHRAKELGLHFVQEAALDKLDPYEKILKAAGMKDEQVCFMGDDIVDLPVLRRVGLAVAVANCDSSLKRHVHYTTRQPGGLGAVRETVELILSAQGKWKSIAKKF